MSECLTIGTYNILKGINADRIVDNIAEMRQQGADVLCLQEVNADPHRPFIGDRIEGYLGKRWGAVYFTGLRDPSRDLGLATYWNKEKCSFSKMEATDLPRLEGLGPYEALHTWHRSTTMRGALSVWLKMYERALKVTNVHLDLLGGIRQRMRQWQHMATHLHTTRDTAHEMICGDCNTIVSEASQERTMRRILGREFAHVSRTVPWTFNLANPDPHSPLSILQHICTIFGVGYRERLDHVFARGMGGESSRVLDLEGSDHYPLVCTLRFPQHLIC